jgi:hypothetical protein
MFATVSVLWRWWRHSTATVRDSDKPQQFGIGGRGGSAKVVGKGMRSAGGVVRPVLVVRAATAGAQKYTGTETRSVVKAAVQTVAEEGAALTLLVFGTNICRMGRKCGKRAAVETLAVQAVTAWQCSS